MEVNNENKIELSPITLEICNRLEEYKSNIKRDMVVGEDKIISGVNIVEEIIKEMNPSKVEDEIIDKIDAIIQKYEMKKERKMHVINNYVRCGIVYAEMIVGSYIITNIEDNNTKKSKRKVKNVCL